MGHAAQWAAMKNRTSANQALASCLVEIELTSEANIRRVRQFAAEQGIDAEVILFWIRKSVNDGSRLRLDEFVALARTELERDPSFTPRTCAESAGELK